ncbi:MAG: hypothetical protein MRJ68_08560 [Nitrospira sp.]|nr:hypothetical protein [Nitrospira sp.]
MPRHGPAWGKLGAREEITKLLEGCAVLEGYAHQPGNHVVEADDLWSTVSSFHTKEEFRRGRSMVHGDIEGTLVRDADLPGDVVAT